jgi:hypothetical protein
LAKVDSFTTVWLVISVSSVWRWAAVGNERAVANARAAATECSRLRVERAEVEQFLLEQRPSTGHAAEGAAATGR